MNLVEEVLHAMNRISRRKGWENELEYKRLKYSAWSEDIA